MSADVVYSDVKFAKKRIKNHETSSPNDLNQDVTYAEVNKGTPKATGTPSPQDDDVTYSTVTIAPAPRKAAETGSLNNEEEYSEVQRGSQPKVHSSGFSTVTKRVIGGVLCGVLVLVVIATVIAVTPCPEKHRCDTDWELNGTTCYYFSKNNLSWTQSEARCKSMDGHLVKIDKRKKQTFLYETLRNIMTEDEDKFWIGLTDSETEGEWKWTDGSSLNQTLKFWFNKESQTEPDDWRGHNNEYPEGEDCVRMGERADGFEDTCWFDKHCDTPQRFICEKKPTQC